uniref:Exonuclease domain-containing protein n=1 Tax=Syphacia muris TaxID=451379 RepID=A0A0N5ABG4_9BILA
MGSDPVSQVYEHFLLLDFEATCEEGRKIQPIQEIIEFPVIQIESSSFKECEQFHCYVRPTKRPFLTTFCTHLTGIECVDESENLSTVLEMFHKWLLHRNLIDLNGERTCPWILVTCGDWDLGTQLPSESEYKGLAIKKYFTEWINLKKAFAEALGYFPNSMSVMLRDLQIEPIGRLHSGIDDVRNMCSILKALALRGHIFSPTAKISKAISSTFPQRVSQKQLFRRKKGLW